MTKYLHRCVLQLQSIKLRSRGFAITSSLFIILNLGLPLDALLPSTERAVEARSTYWGSDTAGKNSWDRAAEDAGTASSNWGDARREGRILCACRDPSVVAGRETPNTCGRNPCCSPVHRMLDNRVLHLEDTLRMSRAPVDNAASMDRTGPVDTAPGTAC